MQNGKRNGYRVQRRQILVNYYNNVSEDATPTRLIGGEHTAEHTKIINQETFYINANTKSLYMIDDLGRHRLCLPENAEQKPFQQAHDGEGHIREYKILHYLNSVVVIRQVASKVKKYLKYCVSCQLTSRPRHKPYGDYHPIVTPNIPFHTITMDFIVAIPPTLTGSNMVLTIVDKASKAIQLIAGKDTGTAKDWGKALGGRFAHR